MISIKPYLAEHKIALVEIFKSNEPLYFAEHELAVFIQFLTEDAFPYYVMFKDDTPIGCGGIAGAEEAVHLCWGMVHSAYHKQGYGKKLLEYRIEQSNKLYPGKKIELQTTQHSWTFFQKYGFRLIRTEKDFWSEGLDLYKMERPADPQG